MTTREVQDILAQAPRIVSYALARGWAAKPARQMSNTEINRFCSTTDKTRRPARKSDARSETEATRTALLGESAPIPSPAPVQVQPQA